MSAELTTVEIAPRTAHQYTIIWLHGLGADGHDFEAIVPQLKLRQQEATRFIFPNAPIQRVTINGGMAMRAWYDILEASLHRRVDERGIYQSVAQINQLIEQEIASGIAPEHILLAGFSQGGVVALHTALCFPKRLAGVVALSTYLPTLAQLEKEAAPVNQNLPIFVAHGSADQIVSIQAGQEIHTVLSARGYPVQWQTYPMQHNVCADEIQQIAAFIDRIFR